MLVDRMREHDHKLRERYLRGDPTASFWFKDALSWALTRDPVDAANDAEELAQVLKERVDIMLGGAS